MDWRKLKVYLERNFELKEIRFYQSLKKRDGGTRNFVQRLKKLGFKVFTKPLKKIKTEEENLIFKANFDVEMTADVLLNIDNKDCDVFILFTGDSDFEYLVKILHKLYKKCFVFSSRKTLSWELKMIADRYFFLEDIKRSIYRKKWGLDK